MGCFTSRSGRPFVLTVRKVVQHPAAPFPGALDNRFGHPRTGYEGPVTIPGRRADTPADPVRARIGSGDRPVCACVPAQPVRGAAQFRVAAGSGLPAVRGPADVARTQPPAGRVRNAHQLVRHRLPAGDSLRVTHSRQRSKQVAVGRIGVGRHTRNGYGCASAATVAAVWSPGK